MDTPVKQDLGEIRRDALEVLRIARETGLEERTAHLRTLAELLVEARAIFQRADGGPDWAGRSYAYRTFIHDLYKDAHYGEEDTRLTQQTVRHHVQERLREVLQPETLEEVGLKAETPNERMRGIRAVQRSLLGSVPQGGVLMALTAAATMLRVVTPESLAALDDREWVIVEAHAEEIMMRMRLVRDAVERRG